jgi:DNA-binding transcriptional LysR family regulator
VHAGATSATGHRAGAWVSFGKGAKPVLMEVGLSFVSVEGAQANLKAEMPDSTDFGEAGVGIAILPEMALAMDGSPRMRCVPIRKPDLSRNIELLQRRDRSLSPAAVKMLEVFRSVAKSRLGRS